MMRRRLRLGFLIAIGAASASRAADATEPNGAMANGATANGATASGPKVGSAAADTTAGRGAGASPGAGSAAGPAKRLAALRHKVLRDEDFVENEDSNRDPFHPYMRLPAEHVDPPREQKLPSAFDKIGIEELTLIAVITGHDTPRAMFRDAAGYGQAVKRGDFLSRSGARVTKILSDRVIVEITETTGAGEPRVVEKAILVNPDEAP
jgi:Tfp pilus assembly protein PilP